MSQAKVDARKAMKANRKEIAKKERIRKTITGVISGCVVLLLVAWIGVSINNDIKAKEEAQAIEVNMDALSDYLNGLE